MKKIAKPLGIIGGSGLYSPDVIVQPQTLNLQTPYGAPSAPLVTGFWREHKIIFMTRHGREHSLAPHQINYRANIWALQEMGAEAVLVINCVGGIHVSLLKAGTLCAPDQFLDYTWGRESSFFTAGKVKHIDMTDPCDVNLRGALLEAGRSFDIYADHCCYAATQGPRLETRAEIDRLERDGADIVGMTAMPEIPLIRELELPVAMLSLVVNAAAGRAHGAIYEEQIAAALKQGMKKVLACVEAMLSL